MTIPKTINDYIRMIDENVETEWDERTRDLWYQIKEWLEELKDLRLVVTCILGEMLQDRPDEFKLYNIKRMIDDYTREQLKGEKND